MSAPLVITHPGGPRTIPAYTVQPRSASWARSPSPTRGAGSVIRNPGDHRQYVTPITFLASLPAASLALAYDLAYTVVAEARSATAIAWHEGTVTVQGLLNWYAVPTDPALITLTLTFMPTTPTITPNPIPPPPP